MCFACTLNLGSSTLGRSLSEKPFHKGKLYPLKSLFCGDLAINSMRINPKDILEVKSGKVRGLMCARDQHMGLIYFKYYQGKKKPN